MNRRQLQRDILSNALRRSSGFVLPLPPAAAADKQAVAQLLEEMIVEQFIVERPLLRHEAFWFDSDSDGGQPTVLVITGLGQRALLTDPSSNALRRAPNGKINGEALQIEASEAATNDPPTRSQSGKIDLLLRALRTDKGATVSELVKVTSWQPRSVRAALSRQVQGRLRMDLQIIETKGSPNRYRLPNDQR